AGPTGAVPKPSRAQPDRRGSRLARGCPPDPPRRVARPRPPRRRVPAADGRSAPLRSARGEPLLSRRAVIAAARRGHGRARRASRGRGALHGEDGRPAGREAARPTHGRPARARARALRHLLLALPRPGGDGERHDRAAGLPRAAVPAHRAAPAGAGRALLRRDDQRLRGDAGLRAPGGRARPLGDRGLHPRAAAQPARDARRRAGGGAAGARDGGPAMSAAAETPLGLERLQQRALVVGMVALGACAAGGLANPADFFRAYLIGYLYCLGIAHVFNNWSLDRDARPDPNPRRFRLLAGPGLALYGLTVTFAAIDWAMSLEPHWYSTIYPAGFGVGQVLSAFAFGIAAAVC